MSGLHRLAEQQAERGRERAEARSPGVSDVVVGDVIEGLGEVTRRDAGGVVVGVRWLSWGALADHRALHDETRS